MRLRYLFFLIAFSFTISAQDLPTQTSTIFSGSGNCESCHAPGPPNTSALLGPDSSDISPVTLWRSTMMANSAKDPYWQAKVTAEVAENPQFQEFIEDECATCHAPVGHREAEELGQMISLEALKQDTLAMDGVTCTVCHQIQDVNFGDGSSFSGGYVIENWRQIYGPYPDPQSPQSMVTNVSYVPTYGPHMLQSEHCATCHTLFTPTIDYNGQIVGEAPEQTPYLEWKNSIYPAMDVQCQNCHVPAIDFPVTISNEPDYISARQPFYKHYFVGGNVFMLKMLKSHASSLGVTAEPVHFDSTIARTMKLLQRETIEISNSYRWLNSTTLQVDVAVKNKSGHKLPTGYPSRRMWAYFKLSDNAGTTLFESGEWDANSGEILDEGAPYEPHHSVLSSDDQVQIYQAIMKDVNDKPTFTLLRMAGYLKDNRLPPEGFSSEGLHYDSIAVYGDALQDGNFNRSGEFQGTATDTISYQISNLTQSEVYDVDVKFYYQSVDPADIQHMSQYSSTEIDSFLSYYQQADKRPVTLDSLSFDILPVGLTFSPTPENLPESPLLMSAYPNPFNPATTIAVNLATPGNFSLDVYNLLGEHVTTLSNELLPSGNHYFRWDGSNAQQVSVSSGIYIVVATNRELTSGLLRQTSSKLVFLK